MSILAEVHWLPEEKGGRRSPPAGGSRYSTVARFPHETDEQWSKEAWSLILDLLEPANAQGVQRGYVHFLSEIAPINWLRPGSRFALYEGRMKVAEGLVLE